MNEVRIVRGLEELRALASAWDRLGSSLPSPMQEHAWTLAAAEAFAGFLEPRIVVVGDPPRAIAPLGLRRATPPRLETLGARDLYEPVDLLYEDESALRELVEALGRIGRPLTLVRLPLDSPAYAALCRSTAGRTLVTVRDRYTMPVLDLDELGEPNGALSPRRRADLRRARRRAERIGDVNVEIAAPGPDEVSALLDEALEVEVRGWKAPAGTALAHDELRLPFYRAYASAAAAAGTLRIALLRIGGRGAAMQLASERAGAVWLLKIAYASEFARCSPGQLLMLETIRYALARRLSRVEFIGSSAAWTRQWTRHERPGGFVHVYPLRASSLPALAYDEARRAARALRG